MAISAKLIFVENQEFIADENAAPPSDEQPLATRAFSPNNPPWGSWTAIGVWFASVVFIAALPLLFLIPYILGQKIDLSDTEFLADFLKSDRIAIILQLLSIIPAHVLTIVLAWLVVTKFRKYSFREMLGWEWNGFRVWHAFALFVIFWGFALLMKLIFGSVENEFEKMIESSRTAVFLVAFFATFTAPLVEEVVYRGLLYSAFQKKLGVVAAVIAVTLLFTLVHVPQYSLNSVPDYATIFTLLMLSLTLTLIRVKTGSLLPCIILHTVVNGIQSAILIAEPYLPKSLSDVQDPTSLFWHVIR